MGNQINRPLLDLVKDATDVFAQDANRQQLHTAEKHHPIFLS